MIEDQYRRAYSYSLSLLKRRLRSAEEVKDKLKQRKYPENTIDRIITDFKNTGLLNDRNFARAWVEDRLNLNPKAPGLLKLELKKKGVSGEIVEKTLKEAEENYDFEEIACDLAKKRFACLAGVKNQTKKKKRIFDYLKRRGFNYSIIYQALNRVFK
jgi:regulatory protein